MNVPDQNNFLVVNKIAREIYKRDRNTFLVSGLTKTEKFRAEIEKKKERIARSAQTGRETQTLTTAGSRKIVEVKIGIAEATCVKSAPSRVSGHLSKCSSKKRLGRLGEGKS